MSFYLQKYDQYLVTVVSATALFFPFFFSFFYVDLLTFFIDSNRKGIVMDGTTCGAIMSVYIITYK